MKAHALSLLGRVVEVHHLEVLGEEEHREQVGLQEMEEEGEAALHHLVELEEVGLHEMEEEEEAALHQLVEVEEGGLREMEEEGEEALDHQGEVEEVVF